MKASETIETVKNRKGSKAFEQHSPEMNAVKFSTREPNSNKHAKTRAVPSKSMGWTQRISSSRIYSFVIVSFGICQSAFRFYLIGTLSSVEKRFSLSSQESSIIIAADAASPLLAAAAFLFCLRRPSTASALSGGVMLSLTGVIASCLPYVIFGAGVPEISKDSSSSRACRDSQDGHCQESSDGPWSASKTGQTSRDISALVAIACLVAGNFFNGLGTVACQVAGASHIANNKTSPAVHFGTQFVCRFIGRGVGLALSSICLTYSERPWAVSADASQESKGIGGWWLGYPVIALCLIINLLALALLANSRENGLENTEKNSGSAAARKTGRNEGSIHVLKRLFTNPLYVFRLFGTIVVNIAMMGYSTTFPKYLEHQFNQSASKASMLTGSTMMFSNIIGTILGASLVHFYRPQPRTIALHSLIVTIVAAVAIGALPSIVAGPLPFRIPGTGVLQESAVPVTTGYMDNVMVFCVIVFAAQFVYATSAIGSAVAVTGSMNAEDRGVGMSMWAAMMNLFAFLPYPIIYSSLTDASCLVWDERFVGKRGACSSYDMPKLTFRLHGTTAAILLLGCTLQGVVVWYTDRPKRFQERADETSKNNKDLAARSEKTRDHNSGEMYVRKRHVPS